MKTQQIDTIIKGVWSGGSLYTCSKCGYWSNISPNICVSKYCEVKQ